MLAQGTQCPSLPSAGPVEAYILTYTCAHTTYILKKHIHTSIILVHSGSTRSEVKISIGKKVSRIGIVVRPASTLKAGA